jgi:hypothetical protein
MKAETFHVPLRHHMLHAMDECPAIAYSKIIGDEDDATRDQEKGTSTHAMVFNTQQCVVYPGAKRQGKEFDRFADEHDGCRIILQGEYDIASRMSDSVRRNKLARELIEGQGVTFEQTILWSQDGRMCRGTPDVVGPGYVADLKTGRSSNPKRFKWDARKFFYDSAMAWYRRAVPQARESFLIVVEKTKPYPCTVFRLNERSLQAGNDLCDRWFELLLECERTGEWPDYSERIVELDIPLRVDSPEFYEVAA